MDNVVTVAAYTFRIVEDASTKDPHKGSIHFLSKQLHKGRPRRVSSAYSNREGDSSEYWVRIQPAPGEDGEGELRQMHSS